MLAGKTYVPLLKTKAAEVAAYRLLSDGAKELTFPIFQLRPWQNANRLSLTIDRIQDAAGGHPFGLALDETKCGAASSKEAQREFDFLFQPQNGFRSYFEFVSEVEGAVPVLQPTLIPDNLLLQIGNAEHLDRGLIVHQRRGAFIPITDSIIGLPPLPHDTLFVVDAGWSRDLTSLEAWAVPIIERIHGALPDAELVPMSSSFPDSFSHIIGDNEEIAHETYFFANIRQRFNQVDLTLGDWGSTRPPQSGGGGVIPPRIDIPRPSSWHVFRSDGEETYCDVAASASAHSCFLNVPDCWGKRFIEATDGEGNGVTGTQKSTQARINIHLTIQSGTSLTITTDEQPYFD